MAWWESESERGSPRISFSFNLSATDRSWSEKPKREDTISTKYTKEFEFCRANNCIKSKTLSYADELFVDGKFLSAGRGFESRPKNMTRHLSLEKSSRPAPVRFPSFPTSKSAASKQSPNLLGRWTDYYLCVLPFSRHKSSRKEFKSATFRSQSADKNFDTSGIEAEDLSKAYTSPSYATNEKLMKCYSVETSKTNISGGIMRVSPVLNVSPALFGFRSSSKKEGRNSLHSPHSPATYMDR